MRSIEDIQGQQFITAESRISREKVEPLESKWIKVLLLFCFSSFYRKKYKIGIGVLLGVLRLKNPGMKDRAHQIFQNKNKFAVMQLVGAW